MLWYSQWTLSVMLAATEPTGFSAWQEYTPWSSGATW